MASRSMIQALNSALDVMMGRDPDVLSFGEDVLAVWLTWMATVHPAAAIVIASLLSALAIFMLYHLFRFLRRSLKRLLAT